MISVIDSIMGSGKTTWSIRYMNTHRDERFVYITPFLEECKRIQNECPGMNFVQPDGFKQDSFRTLLRAGKNICTTHALLSKIKFNNADKENIDKYKYVFILDEAVDVIQPVNNISKFDVRAIFDSKAVEIDKDCYVRWIAEDHETSRFRDIYEMATSGTLIWYNDSLFMWLLPIDTIRAMKDLFIMTFMFEASHLCGYLQAHDIGYTKWYIDNRELKQGEQNLEAEKKRIRNLITIYEGNLNDVGKDECALSATRWKGRTGKQNKADIATRKKTLDNARNFFVHKMQKKSNECIWSAFKGKDISIKSYDTAFVPFNSRATNEYRTRNCLAYLVNIYEHPYVKIWFLDKNIEINENIVALSTMIQWIWRSAIRNGEPIDIYIPSSRMRRILKEWLEM